jgi:predicted transcriptional regulator
MEQTIDIEVWPAVYLGTYDDIDYRTKYKHISRTIVKYFQEIANITYKCKATKNDIINKIYYMHAECKNEAIVMVLFKVGHPFKTVDELITLLLSYDLLKVIEMQESEQHKYILTPLGEAVYEKIRL